MDTEPRLSGLDTALSYPLIQALHGRRARRFSAGAVIPDGPLAFESALDPQPLSDLETMVVLTSAAGNTGWHYAITRNATYAPQFPNYAGAAGGRTFPSAAGFPAAPTTNGRRIRSGSWKSTASPASRT